MLLENAVKLTATDPQVQSYILHGEGCGIVSGDIVAGTLHMLRARTGTPGKHTGAILNQEGKQRIQRAVMVIISCGRLPRAT